MNFLLKTSLLIETEELVFDFHIPGVGKVRLGMRLYYEICVYGTHFCLFLLCTGNSNLKDLGQDKTKSKGCSIQYGKEEM